MNVARAAARRLRDIAGAPGAATRGWRYASRLPAATLDERQTSGGDLERYFDGITAGPGIWKWRHYFDVYERHLARFRGRAPVVVEIGIYSGGSLPMWREYFGPDATIHGVDIEPACRQYAAEGITVHIGDQADPAFWRRFVAEVGAVDVVIDDGGHEAHQQIATLEALLPHIRPGGVHVVEDVHGPAHRFLAYTDGLLRRVNAVRAGQANVAQHQVASVHRYPLVTVIEKPQVRPRFEDPRHGTQWQPFL